MTSRQAERIMHLEVRSIGVGKGRYVYGAFNGSPAPLVQAEGSSKDLSLTRLVQINYDRVGRIVYEQQAYRCLFCGRIKPLQRHHMTKRSKGRDDRRENLCGACPWCHEKIEAGAELFPHPTQVDRMREFGLEYTLTGWRAI